MVGPLRKLDSGIAGDLPASVFFASLIREHWWISPRGSGNSDERLFLGPGGAADNSPGREPWENNQPPHIFLSPRQGATEQLALHDSVVPPGLKHRKLPPETQGLRPGLLSDARLTGASEALIPDIPFAKVPDTSNKSPSPPNTLVFSDDDQGSISPGRVPMSNGCGAGGTVAWTVCR